jgi:hypothetical protein
LTKYKSVKGLTKKNNDCVKKVKRTSSFVQVFEKETKVTSTLIILGSWQKFDPNQGLAGN